MDNSPSWDEPLSAVPEVTNEHIERRDVATVSADQRPSQREYRQYLGIVDALRAAGWDSERQPADSPFAVEDPAFTAITARAAADLPRWRPWRPVSTAGGPRWPRACGPASMLCGTTRWAGTGRTTRSPAARGPGHLDGRGRSVGRLYRGPGGADDGATSTRGGVVALRPPHVRPRRPVVRPDPLLAGSGLGAHQLAGGGRARPGRWYHRAGRRLAHRHPALVEQGFSEYYVTRDGAGIGGQGVLVECRADVGLADGRLIFPSASRFASRHDVVGRRWLRFVRTERRSTRGRRTPDFLFGFLGRHRCAELDRAEFGKVEHVLQVPELDVFDGITVKTQCTDSVSSIVTRSRISPPRWCARPSSDTASGLVAAAEGHARHPTRHCRMTKARL